MSGESLLLALLSPLVTEVKAASTSGRAPRRLQPAALTARLRSILVLHSRKACSLAKKDFVEISDSTTIMRTASVEMNLCCP